jgi:hypothetical protein
MERDAMSNNVGKINTTTVNQKLYRTSGNISLKGKYWSPSVSDNQPVAKPQENSQSFLQILGKRFQAERLA